MEGARIRGDGKYVHPGTFPNPVEAAHAYEEAARHHRWERAKTDFPIRDKVRRAGRGRIADESYYFGENGHMKEDGCAIAKRRWGTPSIGWTYPTDSSSTMVTSRGHPQGALGIRDDPLVVWRGMEDPPPKLPWPGEDAEVEEYTSPPPQETKTISIRFVSRGLVGVVRETMQPAHVSLRLGPDPGPQKEQSDQGPTVR